MPSVYQARIDTKETEVERLIQHIKNNSTSREQQRKQLDLLAALNRRYQKQRQEDSLVEAQIQSYELAFRMGLKRPTRLMWAKSRNIFDRCTEKRYTGGKRS